jgi:rSAM/selenodomain-associated transferase 1
VFLKRPEPGAVKTRLARTIGDAAACELYRQLVSDTLEWASELPRTRLVVFFSPRDAADDCSALLPVGSDAELVPQRSGHLGTRMSAAFDELLRHDCERAALIGTDCPLLDRANIEQAYRNLARHDLVLGPADDGGYYLIALRRPRPTLFHRVPWSTSAVLARTLARSRSAGLQHHLLPALSDIDTAADLAPLATALLEAWDAVRDGRRTDFPLRTFRWLRWRPDRPHHAAVDAVLARGRNRLT